MRVAQLDTSFRQMPHPLPASHVVHGGSAGGNGGAGGQGGDGGSGGGDGGGGAKSQRTPSMRSYQSLLPRPPYWQLLLPLLVLHSPSPSQKAPTAMRSEQKEYAGDLICEQSDTDCRQMPQSRPPSQAVQVGSCGGRGGEGGNGGGLCGGGPPGGRGSRGGAGGGGLGKLHESPDTRMYQSSPTNPLWRMGQLLRKSLVPHSPSPSQNTPNGITVLGGLHVV